GNGQHGCPGGRNGNGRALRRPGL
ncbi:uncharacterized protein METZ01_LOCUS159482, partial [marine metagenome]